jgi:hypothetical protein
MCHGVAPTSLGAVFLGDSRWHPACWRARHDHAARRSRSALFHDHCSRARRLRRLHDAGVGRRRVARFRVRRFRVQRSGRGRCAKDSGHDAPEGETGDADAGAEVCSYPPAHNDPSCPPTYLEAREWCGSNKPCTKDSPTCSYPGAGDGMPDGCFSTAGASCFVMPDGTGTYRCAQ